MSCQGNGAGMNSSTELAEPSRSSRRRGKPKRPGRGDEKQALCKVGGRRLGETFEEMVVLRSITGRTVSGVRVEPEE